MDHQWPQQLDKTIAAGALDQIEAIFAAHVDPGRVAGRIGLKPGILTANCDAMRMIVHGRGGHAARPHESKDPIAAAAQLISTLYLFVPRASDEIAGEDSSHEKNRLPFQFGTDLGHRTGAWPGRR